MKRLFAAIIILGAVACSPAPPVQTDPTRNLSAAGHAAYDAKKVGLALDAVRDVAVEGEKQKVVSSAAALKVLAYHRQITHLIDVTPNGWTATALTGLDQLQKDLTAAEWKQIEPFVQAFKVYIAAVTNGGV